MVVGGKVCLGDLQKVSGGNVSRGLLFDRKMSGGKGLGQVVDAASLARHCRVDFL